MNHPHPIEARTGPLAFDNGTVGEGTFVEPDVCVGFRYHKDCGPARVGKHGILRKGTIIYGDVTIGERSFVAAGAGVTRDVPPQSLVKGVPGKIEPLPADLDRPNNPALTIQPIDIWHPLTPDFRASDWPKE